MNKDNKINVCIILPVLSSLNSILFLIIELLKYNYNIIVLTSNQVGYKGKGLLKRYEVINNVRIFRVADNYTKSNYFNSKFDEINDILAKFNPDIVLFGTWYLYRISKKISKKYNSKLILLTEFFSISNRFIGGRKYYLGLPFLREPVAKVIRNYLLMNTNKIIVSNLTEKNNKFDNKVDFIEWCNHIPDNIDNNIHEYYSKHNQVIFAGSLTETTINDTFVVAVESLIKYKIIERVVIIGDGPKKDVINSLLLKYSGIIDYRGQLPRNEVLIEIGKSKIALLTTINGGWGFIGECFAMGTPLLFTTNHYKFNHMIDSFHFFPENTTNINILINLLNNPVLYTNIQNEMIKRYKMNHSAPGLASKYHTIFQNLITKNV